jgi:hypothetical protein
MVPKFVEPMKSTETPELNKTLQPGRSSFPSQLNLSTWPVGLFAKTLAAANKINSESKALIERTNNTGVKLDQTGYLAFHNLYRFFLKYKKDVSGTDTRSNGERDTTQRPENAKHPLVFFNHKDNNEYNVAVRSFTLKRDKENPMLYFYSITMRGYDLKNVDTSSGTTATKTQSELLAALGLDGVRGSTFLTDAKNFATEARSVLSSVANGTNQLGR